MTEEKELTPQEKMLGSKPIPSLLFKLSLPAIIGLFANSLYNTVDAIFIGRGVGDLALGGVGVAFAAQMIVMAVAQMIGVGSASIVSRALGRKDYEHAGEALGNMFVLGGVGGGLITVVGLVFLEPIVKLLGAPTLLFPYTYEYLQIIFMGSLFSVVAMASNNVVRAEGAATYSMVIMMVGVLVNLVLDPLFIFVFNWGVRGAAIATVLSRVISFLLALSYFLRKKSVVQLKRSFFKPHTPLMREAISLGAGTFLRQGGGSIVIILVNRSFLNFAGNLADSYITIFSIINRVSSFFLMPPFGIIMGLQPIIGYNYGAKNVPRVRKTLNLSAKIVSFYLIAVTLIVAFFTPYLFMPFTTNSELIALGVKPMRLFFTATPFVGLQVIGATYFQCIGKRIPALLLNSVRQVLFLIPLLYFLPRLFGFEGVFYTFPIADTLALVVTVIWFFIEFKELKKMEKE